MADFIDFPIFTGVSGDLRPWISWLEAFFVREKFRKLEKMNLAQSLLEGEAEAWFYLIQKTLIFYSWRELKEKLLLRFGDVADSDRIRLIAEQDRFLMEIRDEARIRRRKTTSIPEKDSIWEAEPEALVLKDTIPVTNRIESRDSILSTKSVQEANSDSMEKDESHAATMVKVEGDTTMNQVPVSSLEPGLSFSSEIIDVSVAWPSEMVSHNRMHSQAAFECVKNKNNAHHVLDEMLLRQHKFQQRKKPSLSPKSRMFKFKNKMLQRNRSQMDPHHVMDSNIVTYISSSSRAKFGFKWKEHNSRYWGRMRQTRLHMRHKWKSKHLRAVVGLQNNPSYALDVVIKPVLECNTTAAISQLVLEPSVSHDCFLGSLWEKKSVSWLGLACVLAECMMHTTTVISAKLYSLFSFEVVTEENISSGLSQTSQVWEPGGVLAEHVLVDWLVDFHDYAEIVEGIRCLVIGVCSGLQQPIDSRRASRVWERGGLDIRTDHGGLLVFPWHLMLLEFFLFFYFGRQAVLDQFTTGLEMKQTMKVLKSWRFKYKPATSSSMLPLYVYQLGVSGKEMVADHVTQCLLGTLLWSTSFKKQKFCKDWWFKFKYNIRIGEAFDYGTIYFWIHNCSRCSCICCSGFYLFTLEVKRHFNGWSIDTFGQVEVMTWQVMVQMEDSK